DGFCNEPAWDETYRRVHHNCLNVCSALQWLSKEGPILRPFQFLKHLFQGDGTLILAEDGRFVNDIGILGDPFTVALDYLTILLQHPKHKLPAIILVSPENVTGKTTFIKFLRILFGSNVVHLGIEQSNMRF